MRMTRELGWVCGGYTLSGLWLTQDFQTSYLLMSVICFIMGVASKLTREPEEVTDDARQ